MKRPKVGETYDWQSKADELQMEVTIVAYDAIRKLFLAVGRNYDSVLDAYGEHYWIVFQQDAEDCFTILQPGPAHEVDQPW